MLFPAIKTENETKITSQFSNVKSYHCQGLNHNTPRLSWHFQSLPSLQVSFRNPREFDEARSLTVRGKSALDSSLGQVILMTIWCLPEICFQWFILLGLHGTGHCCVDIFSMTLVSVDLIRAPTSLDKVKFKERGADKQNVKYGNSGRGQSEMTRSHCPFSKAWG